MKIRTIFLMLTFLCLVGWGPFSFLTSSTNSALLGTQSWIDNETRIISAQTGDLNSDVLRRSLTTYIKAKQKGLVGKPLLTIVDYTKPSSERRLWVIDVQNHKVLFHTWVAHGKNSGDINATSFSNNPSSLKSSLGVFVTDEIYSGKHGTSLRMQGLEHGFNDNAYDRAIVVHGAGYASSDVAKSRGRIGRSWGCLAVSEDVVRPLINAIKHHTVIVAYYPDRNWLRHSTYINA